MSERTLHTAYAWSGVFLLVGFAVGFWLIAGFFPPPDPSGSAEQIAEFFSADADRIKIGMAIQVPSFGLMLFLGVGIAALMRRAPGVSPTLSTIQVACAGIGVFIGLLVVLLWSAAAFRADEVAPDTTRLFHDLGWFLFLATYPPFSTWAFALAAAIFSDRGEQPVFPRWIAYLSIWCGLLYVPGLMVVFFTTGPFAFNGLIAFYVPAAAFFAWLIVVITYYFKAIKRLPADA